MFGIEGGLLVLLILCILAACAFEFVNGFHDTANAVATVIYTNSLPPTAAVVWAGLWNFIGVFFGGITVAMGIVNLLPVESLIDQSVQHSIAMVLALLFSAIIWNLGTWYYGLPSSSTHTLVGSIIGVGLAFSLLPENVDGSAAVNWNKARDIGFSLIISPVFGFSFTVFLMYILRRLVGKKEEIFKEPHKSKAPPTWIRTILILTCTGVSFGHGSNDGQKGVGLVMLILIGILPAMFALNPLMDPTEIRGDIQAIHQFVVSADTTHFTSNEKRSYIILNDCTKHLDTALAYSKSVQVKPAVVSENDRKEQFSIRRDILLISKHAEVILSSENLKSTQIEKAKLKTNLSNMRKLTDYSPGWVTLMISLSLGLGTMIGWKRIVLTIGEKIGKSHLTYAQGASAEIVAASTIGVSSFLGLPVSTTHVLSSGIAGSMVASNGIKNLQKSTVRNIVLAWLLTFPVSLTLSGCLFLLFRWIF